MSSPVKHRVQVPVPSNRSVTRSDLTQFYDRITREWPELLNVLDGVDHSNPRDQEWISDPSGYDTVTVPDAVEGFYKDLAAALGTDMGEAVSVALFIDDLDQLALLLAAADNL